MMRLRDVGALSVGRMCVTHGDVAEYGWLDFVGGEEIGRVGAGIWKVGR